jgi:hypothetical protein
MNYSIKGDLSSKELGGELFIYNRKNSTIYSFNGTGVFIWTMLNKSVAFDEISRRMSEEYDVLPATAAEDVAAFVKELGEKNLITFHKE